jgi:signal transduction histidine kinase
MPSLRRRTRWAYGALILVWAIVLIWQIAEHHRVEQAEKVALINRGKDISSTLGLVMRSQRRFGVISKERIESALHALVRQEEVPAIALLNATGEIVASAGTPIDFETKGLAPAGIHWGERSMTLMTLVDLGTNFTAETEGPRPTLVLPLRDMMGAFGTNRPGTNRPAFPPPGPPPPGPPPDRPDEARPPATDTNGQPILAGAQGGTNAPPRGRGRPPRPFRMSEEEYKAALEKQGVHSFAIVLATKPMLAAVHQDRWLRLLISGFASVSALGLGLAWRTLTRSSDLELRLVRAAELNNRLKEMNLAAAGLAHETKNPLNIIRGLAQMISKRTDAPAEVCEKSRSIVDEADRVAAQLNEFINFSRPREVRRSSVALSLVVGEVVRALGPDLSDKAIRLEVQPDLPVIEADEQQLRQALFNLLLNASQAVEANGEIRVTAAKFGPGEAVLEIRDNGPGVPPEHRADIFKPYFTTNEKGTGLGLAVVQQIVLAHGWEIECLANEPRGALFRISHVRLAGAA